MDDIIIRTAQAGDAGAIGQLWEKLVNYHHQLDAGLPKAAENGAEIYARRIQDQSNDSFTAIIVAEHEQAIIGFALGVIVDMAPQMFEQETSGFLADIFVEEHYRRTGVGKRLISKLADWFKSRGVMQMEWHVAAKNKDGRAFWDAIGGRDIMIRMKIKLEDLDQ